MLIAFFLFETFKEDVASEVIPATNYVSTLRRKIVDIAAKITETSRSITLRVSKATMKNLKFDLLWANCQNPPLILS